MSSGSGTCRACGCTDASPCAGGCCWVEPDLCSDCAPDEQLVDLRAFSASWISCSCGFRMVAATVPQPRTAFVALARPSVLVPGEASERATEARQALERLDRDAAAFGELVGRELVFDRVDSWVCQACGRITHCQSYLPADVAGEESTHEEAK